MIQCRSLKAEDLSGVAELEKAIFPDAWSLSSIEETFQQKCTVLFGAFDKEELIGYLIVYEVAGEAEIARIAVSENHRREGVAARLLFALEQQMEEIGANKILLDVRESNEAAIAFYRDARFEEDGLRKDFYENPLEDAVLMSRELGK